MLSEHHLDPVATQGLAQRLTQRRGLARKDAVGAIDDHGLASETLYYLRQLDPRRPATEHEQAARNGLHARRLARAPDPLELTESRDRRHDWI